MAYVTRYPMVRHLRADAANHIQYFRQGERVRSGRGLAFWFAPDGASISEIPMDDRELPFLLKGQSADYQDLTVQGGLVWRVVNPETLGERIDFSIDLAKGELIGKPVDQINNALVTLTRRFALSYLKNLTVRDVLERGIAPLQEAIGEGFAASDTLDGMGLQLVAAGVADIAPSSELARALQAPTFESLQQKADEASFARRALAVEKERAISENELNNRIELATQQKDLIAREAENTRSEAEAKAAALTISAEAEAGRIRVIEQAKADMEGRRIDLVSGLPPSVLMAFAAREFAGKLNRIDSLTITPDMLSGIGNQLKGLLATPAATPEPTTVAMETIE